MLWTLGLQSTPFGNLFILVCDINKMTGATTGKGWKRFALSHFSGLEKAKSILREVRALCSPSLLYKGFFLKRCIDREHNNVRKSSERQGTTKESFHLC